MRTAHLFDPCERRPTREGEINVIGWQLRQREIGTIAPLQRRQGYRRVYVIKGCSSLRLGDGPVTHGDPVRNIGPDNDRISSRHPAAEAIVEISKAVIKFDFAERPGMKIAVFRIPRHIPLEEEDAVTTARQTFDEAAPGGGMAVAP